MKYKIVLQPFPYDDLSSTKLRPALCLTDLIGAYDHVVVAYITSRIPAVLLDTDVLLDASHPDFGATGLQASSIIRLHHLITVRVSVIQRQLGTLPVSLQADVSSHLKKVFDLTDGGP